MTLPTRIPTLRGSELPIMAAAFAILTVGAALLMGDSGVGIHQAHLLFMVAAGFAAYGAGVTGATVVIAATAFILIRLGGLPPELYGGPLAECFVMALMSVLLRKRLARMAQSDLREQSDLRTAAESALEQVDNRYRQMVNQARDIVFTLDAEARLLSLNPAFHAVLGLEVSDWIGRSVLELVVPEQREEFAARFAEASTTSPLTRFHATALGAEGRRVVIEASWSIQSGEGEPFVLLGLGRDITEREAAEAGRRRSEKQLAESQRLARLGSWDRNLDLGTESWSDELYSILEVDPNAITPSFETFASMVVSEDRPRIDAMRTALRTTPSQQLEVSVQVASGARKHLRVSARSYRDGKGRQRVFGAIQDVTEQKRAEQLLSDSEQRFRLLARATNDAVWDWDCLADVFWRGEAYETLFGYAPGVLKPTKAAWEQRIHPEDRERVILSFHTAIDSGQLSWSEEYRFQRSDETWATVLDRGYIVRDEAMRPVRVLGAMMDLTEQKQLEQQLAQSHRLSSLGRVSASIAHEFNNVLMGIQPNVEVIQRRAPAEFGRVVDNITLAVRRGKRITDEILRFTRPTEPHFQSKEIREFFDEWREEAQPLLGSRFPLSIVLPEEATYISADPLLMSQVFTNLAVNARDAMEETGGTISIEAEPATSFSTFRFGVVRSPDRYVHLRIIDRGSGISSDRLQHIFEPLFTTKRGGTGLGLAISHQIITRHSGHIFVESEVGRGTTFHVFIPLALAPSALLPAPQRLDSPAVPSRILLVEDEPAVSAGVGMLLELEGSVVEIVDRGAAAVEAIERFHPDLVILDIGLPDIDGVEVYRRIDERWPSMPVLFSSGHAHAAALERFISKPHVGLLTKPYDFATLADAIASLRETAVRSA